MTEPLPENKADLIINGLRVANNTFVDSFIAGVADGLVSPLSGRSCYRALNIVIEEEKCLVEFDGASASTNDFVDNMIKTTLIGMAGVLGISGTVERLTLRVNN